MMMINLDDDDDSDDDDFVSDDVHSYLVSSHHLQENPTYHT